MTLEPDPQEFASELRQFARIELRVAETMMDGVVDTRDPGTSLRRRQLAVIAFEAANRAFLAAADLETIDLGSPN